MQHIPSTPSRSRFNLFFALLLLVLPFIAQPASANAAGNQEPTYDWSDDTFTPAEYDWSDD